MPASYLLTRRDFVRVGVAATVTPYLVGCGTSPVIPQGDPLLSARPGDPSQSGELGSITELRLGGARDGFYYIPSTWDGAAALPLVVTLHGAGQDALFWHSYVARAEARGFTLLSLDSRYATWDLVIGAYGPDVTFMNEALTFLFDRVRVNAAKLALVGFSDGASYSLSLGRINGDLFSHVVGYSPGFADLASAKHGNPPVYISHGNADTILPFSYTKNTIVPGLEQDGHDVTFQEFDGGHQVPAVVSEAMLDWFFG